MSYIPHKTNGFEPMKEVLLEKYMDFSIITKVSFLLLGMVGITKIVGLVATRIPNVC